MKKSKIKKSMLAIPELLRQCLLSSLLYKLSLSLDSSPLFLRLPSFLQISSFSSYSYFSLPQQATTNSTIPPLSKHGISDHQHGRPCLFAAGLTRREGVPHLPRVLPALPDGETTSFQCYKNPLKKTNRLWLLKRGSTQSHHYNF